MALSGTVQYAIIFGVTIIFSLLALTSDKQGYAVRVITRFIAGFCWLIMAVLQFVIGNTLEILTIALSTFFFGFAAIFMFSAISAIFGERATEPFFTERKMGDFKNV